VFVRDTATAPQFSPRLKKKDTPVVHVYPNPVNNTLYLDSPVRLSGAVLMLADLNGRAALRTKLGPSQKGNVYSVDLSGLQTGIYLLKLTGPQGVYTSKIIKL
jgi:hypothetical protein